MKPRLRPFLPRLGTQHFKGWWVCDGSGILRIGPNPRAAYLDWLRARHPDNPFRHMLVRA